MAEVRYRENLDICQRLAAISPYAYEPDLAGTQNNLGVLYNNTQRYKESEKMYLSALKIYQRLTAANPQVYEPDLAMTQNNLGLLYSDIRRYEESEEMHLRRGDLSTAHDSESTGVRAGFGNGSK